MKDKKREREQRIQDRILKIVSENMPIMALETLTLMLRSYDSAKTLAEAYSLEIRKQIRKLMNSLGIKEYIVKRTIVKMVYVYKFPTSEEKARKVYEKLIEKYGKERVEQWVEASIEKIPATTKMIYKIKEEAIDGIQKEGIESEFISILGTTPQIYIGPIPKRAKIGEKLSRKKHSAG